MASRSQKKQICQGHPSRSNPSSKDGERARGKSYRPICDLFAPKDSLPKWLAAARKPELSRSSFKVKSEVKGRGTGKRKKLPTDLRSFCSKMYPTKMASRSQKTRFAKVILQGQIRAQRTGNGLEAKVTDRFAIFLFKNVAHQSG